jgi:hypothetical protein
MMNDVPSFIAVIIAMLGTGGAVAALMRVNTDNSKTISEGAVNVVEAMQSQIKANSERLDALEGYASRFDDWADKVSTLLTRAIDNMTEPPRESFRTEAEAIAKSRPKRRNGDPKPTIAARREDA